MVYFVGAGCGAPDLITLRGKHLIEKADVLIYAGSLVNPMLLLYARPDCRIYNSAVMTLDEVMDVMREAHFPLEQAGQVGAGVYSGQEETDNGRKSKTAPDNPGSKEMGIGTNEKMQTDSGAGAEMRTSDADMEAVTNADTNTDAERKTHTNIETKKAAARPVVVRLHTGEPSLYGAVREQMDALDRLGIPYESCPGVSACFGAAASMNAEFTLPGVSQTLIITRMEGRTAVPRGESIESLASHGASMAIYLSASMTEKLQESLLRGDYVADTPAAIVYKATWPEQKICRCTVGTLHRTCRKEGIDRIAVILVGKAIAAHGNEYEKSRLYAPDFETGFRKASKGSFLEDTSSERDYKSDHKKDQNEYSSTKTCDNMESLKQRRTSSSEKPWKVRKSADEADARNNPGQQTAKECFRTAPEIVRVATFSPEGRRTAKRLFDGQDEWIPEMRAEEENLSEWTGKAFHQHLPILFVGAAGIAVRAISPLVRDKLSDSAVLVMDEDGRTIIPLLSGHVGGANDLAQRMARRMGAQAVITTGTDVRGRFSPDVFARRNALTIRNRKAIQKVAERSLRGQTIRIGLQAEILLPQETVPEDISCFYVEKNADHNTNIADILICTSTDERSLKEQTGDGERKNFGREGSEKYFSEKKTSEIKTFGKASLKKRSVEKADGSTLLLTPKLYIIGLGCRRGKSFEELNERLLEAVGKLSDSAKQDRVQPGDVRKRRIPEQWIRENVSAFATIDLKSDEYGLILLAQYYHLPLYLFSAQQLESLDGDFSGSTFVKEVTGVSNVCERAAVLAGGAGSRLVLPKQAAGGVTVAAALHPARIVTWNTDAGFER